MGVLSWFFCELGTWDTGDTKAAHSSLLSSLLLCQLCKCKPGLSSSGGPETLAFFLASQQLNLSYSVLRSDVIFLNSSLGWVAFLGSESRGQPPGHRQVKGHMPQRQAADTFFLLSLIAPSFIKSFELLWATRELIWISMSLTDRLKISHMWDLKTPNLEKEECSDQMQDRESEGRGNAGKKG